MVAHHSLYLLQGVPPAFKIVRVMVERYLNHSGAEILIHIESAMTGISLLTRGNAASCQSDGGTFHPRMYTATTVSQHCFRPCSGNFHKALLSCYGIPDMPEVSRLLSCSPLHQYGGLAYGHQFIIHEPL